MSKRAHPLALPKHLRVQQPVPGAQLNTLNRPLVPSNHQQQREADADDSHPFTSTRDSGQPDINPSSRPNAQATSNSHDHSPEVSVKETTHVAQPQDSSSPSLVINREHAIPTETPAAEPKRRWRVWTVVIVLLIALVFLAGYAGLYADEPLPHAVTMAASTEHGLLAAKLQNTTRVVREGTLSCQANITANSERASKSGEAIRAKGEAAVMCVSEVVQAAKDLSKNVTKDPELEDGCARLLRTVDAALHATSDAEKLALQSIETVKQVAVKVKNELDEVKADLAEERSLLNNAIKALTADNLDKTSPSRAVQLKRRFDKTFTVHTALESTQLHQSTYRERQGQVYHSLKFLRSNTLCQAPGGAETDTGQMFEALKAMIAAWVGNEPSAVAAFDDWWNN